MKLRRCVQGFAASGGGIVWPGVAAAHLKWFRTYDVSAKPVPVADPLALPAFWAAFALVAAVLLAVGAVEHGPLGRGIVRILDRLTSVPRAAADRLMVCTIGALFVALFAGGTTILTPELVTSASWVGWVQLGIPACIPYRPSGSLCCGGSRWSNTTCFTCSTIWRSISASPGTWC